MNTSSPTTFDSATLKKFNELVKDIRVAMFTTATTNGELRSRPMAVMEAEFDGDLWFFTDDDSPKIDEVLSERHVCVSFAAPDKQRYVSVSGVAALVRDKQRAKELWSVAAKPWFPRGVDDPHLAMLRVTPHSVEYWDAPSSKMVMLYELAKAAVTGKRADKIGEHQKIDVVPPSERM